MKLFLYVQHLLGTGHLVRAALIAEAARAAGHHVTLVQGGLPVAGLVSAGIDLVQLPPLKAGPAGFRELVDGAGRPIDGAFRHDRRQCLLQAFSDRRPDVLMIESFPFGRRQMRFELLPLLERARQTGTGLVACSIRDILQERPSERVAETVELVERWFDVVLVHGDPAFVPLDASFPAAGEIASKTRYTGLVSAAPGALEGPRFDVVVSAGGGAVGSSLLDTALEARRRSPLREASWLVLAGDNMNAVQYERMRAGMPHGVVLGRRRPDFRALLAQATLSISQAGYNTCADLLRCDCASVLVPFSAGGETEQSLRAERMAELGLAQTLAERDLTPARLAEAIARALARSVRPPVRLNLDGAGRTVRILEALLQEARLRR